MQKVSGFAKSKLRQFILSERPVMHTAWEVAAGALVAGLLSVHSTADVKLVLTGAVTSGFAALKAGVKAQLGK